MYGMMKLPELTLKLGLHTDKGRTLIVGGANQRLQRSSNKSRKGAQTTANEHSVILADLSQSQPSLSFAHLCLLHLPPYLLLKLSTNAISDVASWCYKYKWVLWVALGEAR